MASKDTGAGQSQNRVVLGPTEGVSAPDHDVALGQLAEQQLDPLSSPVLQQELPGLTTAFDEQAMRAHMQAALFDERRPDMRIERCEVDQASYVADECVILRYLLTLQDSRGA